MTSGPSPNSTSPSNLSVSPFNHGSFSSTASSPPTAAFHQQKTMTADVFTGASAPSSHAFGLAPIGERRPLEKNNTSLLNFSDMEAALNNTELRTATPAILMRKLPASTGNEALRSMLLFAKDLIDAELITPRFPEDSGFAAAIARFKTLAGAQEARDRLNGKANAANDANMIVELVQDTLPANFGARRNTVDGSSTRQGSAAAAPMASANGQPNRQSSRYNGTFQSLEKMSPPNAGTGLGNGEFSISENGTHIQSLFSPTSPVTNSFGHHNLGKDIINNDGDDETEGLLKESIGYATSSQNIAVPMPRRTTNPAIPPVSRYNSLSLNTTSNGMTSPPMANYASPRTAAPIQSPTSTISALSPHSVPGTMAAMGPNGNYPQFNQHYQRHNYPPVNPADQNPPCNTLYVGNLPIDTSEDELKALFSKQRGYKRLCFRTKQNGPMCFVEFEDISFATKALNELYGHPLHNSVKGGIRLSFSKNPLGVRTGQNNNMGAQAVMAQQAALPGLGGNIAAPPGFSTATGPPPGLAAPPGLSAPPHLNNASSFGVFSNGGFAPPPSELSNPRAQFNPANGAPTAPGNGFGGLTGNYPNYMMGR